MKKQLLITTYSIVLILSGIFFIFKGITEFSSSHRNDFKKTEKVSNIIPKVNEYSTTSNSYEDFEIQTVYTPSKNNDYDILTQRDQIKQFLNGENTNQLDTLSNKNNIKSSATRYRFEQLEQRPDLNFAEIYGVNSNGYIYGRTSDINGNQLPTVWDSTGNIVKRIEYSCQRNGLFTDMNSQNILIGLCLNDFGGDLQIEAFVYDLELDNYTILPNIAESTRAQALSINSSGQIVGTIYAPSMTVTYRPVYWEKQGSQYVLFDITEIITNSTNLVLTEIIADHIFENGDILINAVDYENQKNFEGYFTFVPDQNPNWVLTQEWTSPNSMFVNSANEKYVEFSTSRVIDGELFASSDIYLRSGNEQKKLDLVFNQNSYYEGLGYNNITMVSCNAITPNNDIMCLLVGEEEGAGYFREVMLNLDFFTFTDIRKLFQDNLVEIPEGYFFYPSTIEANGSILGQYRTANMSIYVGRIVPIIEPTIGEILTDQQQYEIGETFVANYIIKYGKRGVTYSLNVHNANATIPPEFYSFPEGSCELISQSQTEYTWNCTLTKDIYELKIPVTIDTKMSWYNNLELNLYSTDGSINISQKIALVIGEYESEYLTIKSYISKKYNIPLYSIFLKSKEYVEWSDGCLGIYVPNEMCLQVITPGYKLIFATTEITTPNEFTIHTDLEMSYFKEAIIRPIGLKKENTVKR